MESYDDEEVVSEQRNGDYVKKNLRWYLYI
jgi:hypothetical protein